jgi:hypothetical protein
LPRNVLGEDACVPRSSNIVRKMDQNVPKKDVSTEDLRDGVQEL